MEGLESVLGTKARPSKGALQYAIGAYYRGMELEKLKRFSRIEIDGFPSNPKPSKNQVEKVKPIAPANVVVKETAVIADDKNINDLVKSVEDNVPIKKQTANRSLSQMWTDEYLKTRYGISQDAYDYNYCPYERKNNSSSMWDLYDFNDSQSRRNIEIEIEKKIQQELLNERNEQRIFDQQDEVYYSETKIESNFSLWPFFALIMIIAGLLYLSL